MPNHFPRVNFALQNNASVSAIDSPVVCILGHSTQNTGLLKKDLLDANQVDSFYGKNQHISKGLRAVFKSIKSVRKPKIYAYAFADEAGWTKATGSFTVGSASTKNFTLQFAIDTLNANDKRLYQVNIANGDTDAQIASKIKASIDNDPYAVVVATIDTENTANIVDLTAVNGGIQGNDIGIKILDYERIDGLTISFSALSGGSGFPDAVALSGFLSAIENDRIHFLATDYNQATVLGALGDEFANRNENLVENFVKDGSVIACVHDTYANISTLTATLTKSTRNPLVLFGLEKYTSPSYAGTLAFNSPLETACLIATTIALLGVERANTNPYIQNFAYGEDGGYATNALHNLKLPFLAYQSNKNFTLAQRQALEVAQASLVYVDGNTIKTATLSTLTSDVNYKFLERELQIQVVKEFLVKSLTNDYSNAFVSASNNAIIPGRIVATPNTIKASFGGYFDNLVQIGLFDVSKKREFLEVLEANLQINTDAQAGGSFSLLLLFPTLEVLREIAITGFKEFN